MRDLAVGLDFGTSNSGISLYDGRTLTTLPIDNKSITPQVVKTILYITRTQEIFIGQEAIDRYYLQNVNRPRRYVMQWVGEIDYFGGDMHYVRDVFVEVDELNPGRLLQFLKTGLRTRGYQGTVIFDRYYDLKDIIATYLRELKTRAEEILGERIARVTLGRPVHFMDDPQLERQSEGTLLEAAGAAGFEQVTLELEPIAAALFYEKTLSTDQNALIFDFGGGTLDITIMRLGSPSRRKIYAVGGIGIAGADFDRTIIQKRMLEHFGKGKLEDPEIDRWISDLSDWQTIPELATPTVHTKLNSAMKEAGYLARLKALESLIFNNLAFSFYNRVEAAKIELSDQSATLVEMEDENINIWELLTRFQFENDIHDQRKAIEDCLIKTIEDSGLEPDQIDAAITTGGSSSIPCFSEMLKDFFGAEKVKESNRFSSVTGGLAISAYERVSF